MTCKAGQMSVHVVSAVNIVKTRDRSAEFGETGRAHSNGLGKSSRKQSLNFGRTDPPRAGVLIIFLFFLLSRN